MASRGEEGYREYDSLAPVYDDKYGGYDADVAFYRDLALAAGGSVLELGCGTGRVLLPISEAGVTVTGIDRSAAMLGVARQKLEQCPPEVQGRTALVEADMRDFDLGGERFALVYIPFRSFLHLLTVDDQLAALATIGRHLAAGGRLVIDLFTNRLDVMAARPAPAPGQRQSQGVSPLLNGSTELPSGERVLHWALPRFDPAKQLVRMLYFHDRTDSSGRLVERVYGESVLRWIYRYEAEHLFARAGYDVEALYGDFNRRPYEREDDEQLWVLRRED